VSLKYQIGFVTGSILAITIYLALKVLRKRRKEASEE